MAQGASSLRRLPTYINHQKTGNYSSQHKCEISCARCGTFQSAITRLYLPNAKELVDREYKFQVSISYYSPLPSQLTCNHCGKQNTRVSISYYSPLPSGVISS